MPYTGPVIDIHTHIFSAHYVPLRGILEAHKVPEPFCTLFATLLNLLAGKATAYPDGTEGRLLQQAYSFESRPKNIEDMAKILTELSVTELSSMMYRKDLLTPARLQAFSVGELDVQLMDKDLYRTLTSIEKLAAENGVQVSAERFPGMEGMKIKTIDSMMAVTTMQRGLFNRFFKPIQWFIGKILEFLDTCGLSSVDGYIAFILIMLGDDDAIARQLFAVYKEDQNVEIALHLMMDMQLAFDNDEPVCEFLEQIDRGKKVTEGFNANSPKRLLGFVAFDPRRAERSLIYVREGLAKGNIGVKVYPPLGYKASGNAGDSAKLNKYLDTLFTTCEDEGIPVTTHCTAKGFESIPKLSGINSDPDFWTPVLEKHTVLRLNYGHAGGVGGIKKMIDGKDVLYPGWGHVDDDWDKNDKNFARKVVEHCRKYEHVYCDVAYYNEIMESEEAKKNFEVNFKREMTKPATPEQKYLFSDKVMFGSDWHMPDMSRQASAFLNYLQKLFDDPELKPHAEKFFYKNALKFLNLKHQLVLQQMLKVGPLILPEQPDILRKVLNGEI